jgi:FkbM family methyltransferase
MTRFLFIVRQKKNVDTFEAVIAHLLAEGHTVVLAMQEPLDQEHRAALTARFDRGQLQVVACPEGRGDAWRAAAPVLRSARDWAQYLRPAYRDAAKLRARAARRLAKELGVDDAWEAGPLLPGLQGARLQQALKLVEESIPSDRLHEEFIARHTPDVVLVTPGLHFGSAQTDFIKSARALGVPVWMLLFSWDNLSTKGALHTAPELMFVWNERQRREATELHDFPAERVLVAGAPRFDGFFALQTVVPRRDFFAPLALDPAAPTVLYVCSSRFIAERELPFIEQWLAALRRSPGTALRGCNVIVRPHPDVRLVDGGPSPEAVTWPAMPQATGWIQRPFADRQALVLRTTYGTPQAFYECLHHSAAVVGLNTSAELEAGIAGRPVFTLLSHEAGADGQSNTLHFNYLLREHGGFVVCAADVDAHVAQLADALTAPPDHARIQAFIDTFLRPRGPQPVAPLLSRMLVEQAASIIRPESPSAAPPQRLTALDEQLGADDDVGVPEEARKKVVLGYPGSTARVLTTPETRPTRRKGVLVLDAPTVAWLDEQVHPGDVVYDIGAGVGAYALVVALHRGGVCVAFEPGFASFKRLCDNLLLNGCYRSIVPIPVALGDRTGLLELEYPGEAGGHGNSLRARDWRIRRDAIEAHYTQPVCAERLEDVVARHRLPKPAVMRIAVRRGAAAVMRGAGAVLRDGDVRSILVTTKDSDDAETVAREAAALSFAASNIAGAGSHHRVILTRMQPASARTALAHHRPGLLRRVAGRLRKLP